MSFRTAREAISLANNTLYGLGASVWSQQIGLAMEVACNIKAGSVWINNHNLFDAATGFGGFKESGYGRDGGKEVGWLFYRFWVTQRENIFTRLWFWNISTQTSQWYVTFSQYSFRDP